LDVLGGGNMTTAILTRMDLSVFRPIVCEIISTQRQKLRERFDIPLVDEFSRVVEADILLFAVKPQSIAEVLKSLKIFDLSNKTVISIMAGVTLKTLKSSLKGTGIKFVRTMPNLPLMIGKGVTGVYLENNDARESVEALLGKVSELFFFDKEELLNEVTALSGSGPAYFLAFIESLCNAGVDMGLPKAVATKMAIGTALGAACLAQSTDDIGTLRKSVTSKGGTTEQALLHLHNAGLDQIVRDAVFAALKRSKELAKQSKL